MVFQGSMFLSLLIFNFFRHCSSAFLLLPSSADGSCYIGCWTNDSCRSGNRNQTLNGTFYPSHNSKNGVSNGDAKNGGFNTNFGCKLSAPLLVVGEDSVDMVVGGVAGKKRLSVGVDRAFPRICIWESDGEEGDITCDIIDNVEASMLYRDGFVFDRDAIKQFRKTPCFLGGEAKKPGQTISKGHKNYELMLNL